MRLIVLAVAVQCFASAYGLPSLLDLLAANNATTLLQLVNQAGLADVLRSEGKTLGQQAYTIFCISMTEKKNQFSDDRLL